MTINHDFPAEPHGASHQFEGGDAVPGAIPLGGIILWSGAVAAVPYGWHICDGTNGTPDLRDKFVVGAGNSYAVAAGGGAATTSASHTNNHSTESAHTHSVTPNSQSPHSYADSLGTVPAAPTAATSGAGTGHTHTAHADHSAIATLPPYYALAFIQRIL